jgi:phage shock protein C
MTTRYAPDKANAKLLGVCAGIARSADCDPIFVRIAALVALIAFGPIAVAAYIIAAWLGD